MGYLCPVCEEPFSDDQQCANHLAVTAILHGGLHETWLAEAVAERLNVDDWESVPRADLADIVAATAEETTDHDHPGDHTHPVGESHEGASQQRSATQPSGQPAITESAADVGSLDADAQAVLREARALTERMQDRGPDGEDRTEPPSADERKES